MNNNIVIVFVFVIAAVAIALGILMANTPVSKPELYNITKDGVEYVFSSNIYDALDVPIYGKEEIYMKLALTTDIGILFSNSTDNSYVAMYGAELASKLSKYYAYTQGRIVNISGFEMSNMTNTTPMNTIIEFRSPNSGADETAVRLDGDRILIQALNISELNMVTDRLALVLFEDDLRT